MVGTWYVIDAEGYTTNRIVWDGQLRDTEHPGAWGGPPAGCTVSETPGMDRPEPEPEPKPG